MEENRKNNYDFVDDENNKQNTINNNSENLDLNFLKNNWVGVIGLIIIVIICCKFFSSCGDNEKNLDSVDLPNYTGVVLSTATKKAEALGFKVESESVTDESVMDYDNWKIVSQERVKDTVFFTVDRTDESKQEENRLREETENNNKKTIGGINSADAQVACSNKAESIYPYGVKIHWFLDKRYSFYDDTSDKWRFIVGMTITNAFNAKSKHTLSCSVTGEPNNPQITNFYVN